MRIFLVLFSNIILLLTTGQRVENETIIIIILYHDNLALKIEIFRISLLSVIIHIKSLQ